MAIGILIAYRCDVGSLSGEIMKSAGYRILLLFSMCLVIYGCGTSDKYPEEVSALFTIDLATNDVISDYDPTIFWNYFTAYWMDENNVLYHEAKVFNRSPGASRFLQIIPDSLDCSSTEKLLFSPDRSRIYFSANGDIYSCGLHGEALLNHTTADPCYIINPRLSPDGAYLSAIHRITGNWGRIVLLNLNSGVLTELEHTDAARVAYFDPATNMLMWVANNPESSNGYYISLFRSWGDGSQARVLADLSSDYKIDRSPDGRYYILETYDRSRFLNIYDSWEDGFTDIGYGQNFVCAWNSPLIYYSYWRGEDSRLMSYNLYSKEKAVIYDDQYYGVKLQAFRNISLRGDNRYINFMASYRANIKDGGKNEITH